MMSFPIGVLSFVGVIVYASFGARGSDYVNFHAFAVVFLGTVAVFLIGNSGAVIKVTGQRVAKLFRARPSVAGVKSELMSLANDKSSIKKSNDPLINYALTLWERGLDSHTFQALMSQFRDKLETDDVEAISALQNISKYPPALGMLGTVMGMISLFANLGSSDKSGLGPSLAVAMTATFYGLVIANGFIMPLADRIHVEATFRKKYYSLVYEILTLIHRREPVSMIEEEIHYREAA